MPDLGVSINNYNNDIQISAPEGWNTFNIGDDIGLNVEVISEYPIAFPRDFGARIFMYQDQEWMEIQNEMDNPEGIVILSPTKDDPFNSGTAIISPDLPDNNKLVELRIVLIGNLYLDGQITEDITAGYIDVELTP
jgi:hypothetical protein